MSSATSSSSAFHFTSQIASKKRPAVVVSNRSYNTARPDVVIMAITSQLRPATTPGDVLIGQWQATGLLKPSAIKPVFATVEQSLIVRRLGTLGQQDQAALRASMAAILG
jgi:mRNA interferase MazF